MAQFDDDSIRRIIRSVLWTERQIIGNIAREELGSPRDYPLYGIVRGKPTTSVEPQGTDAGTAAGNIFHMREVVPLGESTPWPRQEPLGPIVNVPQATIGTDDWCYAIYRYATEITGTIGTGSGTGHGNWELLTFGSGGSSSLTSGAYVILVNSISAASINGSDITADPGVGTGYLVSLNLETLQFEPVLVGTGTGTAEEKKTVKVLNCTYTTVSATVSEPLLLPGFLESSGSGTGTGTANHDAVFVIAGDKDFRGLPGFQLGEAQVPYKDESARNFQLGAEECGTVGS